MTTNHKARLLIGAIAAVVLAGCAGFPDTGPGGPGDRFVPHHGLYR